MKKYNYYGNSTLSFSHKEGEKENDFLASGTGPHELPEDAEIVKTHVALGTLVEVDEVEPKKKH